MLRLLAALLVLLPAIALAGLAGPATVIDGDTLERRGERIYHVPGNAVRPRRGS